MRRPEELNSMLKLAVQREQAAQQQWLKARGQAEQAERQLRELQNYAGDYQAGTVAANSVGDLLNRKHFVQRLQTAVAQQGRVCEQARQTEQAYLGRWRKQQQNLKALENLKDQRRQAVAEARARLEQKTIDEFALRSLGTRR